MESVAALWHNVGFFPRQSKAEAERFKANRARVVLLSHVVRRNNGRGLRVGRGVGMWRRAGVAWRRSGIAAGGARWLRVEI